MSKEEATYSTAHELAGRQRDISVAEFFLKNRHLLGFDSPSKALLITVKEAVDNALDACEEAGVLTGIQVEIEDRWENIFRVAVEDNGPGILENQIPRIFGKLLYGSCFHKLSQSHGQQGRHLGRRHVCPAHHRQVAACHQPRRGRIHGHRAVRHHRYREEPA